MSLIYCIDKTIIFRRENIIWLNFYNFMFCIVIYIFWVCLFDFIGSVWTASAHIITAVIGSGVLSLAWATAQLGWIAGPTVLFLFSFVTYYTSCLLASCYRSDDGKRNYTYMEAVQANLGNFFSPLQIPTI